MTIERVSGVSKGRSRTVIHAGIVYTVGTACSESTSVGTQTELALGYIDRSLIGAGSDRSRILSVTIYLSDMAAKDEMDAVWCDWIGERENWPQRACVGAALAGNDLVEIIVTAAVKD